MKSNTYCLAAFVLMQVACSTTPPAADTSPTDATHHPFVDLVDESKPDMPNAAYWDFGTRSLADSAPIVHEFVLHNRADSSAQVDHLTPLCGCTTATSDAVPAAGGSAYKPVDPGSDMPIKVSVDPGHLFAGPADKTVSVYIVGHTDQPVFTLHVTGTMTPVATFSPSLIYFGNVKSGEMPSKTLTVTIEKSAFGSKTPDPIPSSPALIVTRKPGVTDVETPTEVTRTYTVQLSAKAPTGYLSVSVGMPPRDGHVIPGSSMFVSGTVVAGAPAPLVDKPKPVEASSTMPDDKPYPATNFTITDATGKKRSLSDYRGQPVALLFYCGCDWCHTMAPMWGDLQRSGGLPLSPSKQPIKTLVVFQGNADQAKTFAAETGLDAASTVLLPDVDDNVTNLYDLDVCPRIFIVDSKGNVTYTNKHQDDAARVGNNSPNPKQDVQRYTILRARALDALRKAAAGA